MELRYATEQIIRVGILLEPQAVGYPIIPITGTLLTRFWWGYLIQADGIVIDIRTRIWSDILHCDGMYFLTLTATDTDVLGSLDLYIGDPFLLGKQIRQQYSIITQDAWDAKYSNGLLAVDSRHAQQG